MKKIIASTAALMFITAGTISAGNLSEFEAPEEVIAEEPMGGSNAAWIVPLIAIIAIAVASGGGDDDDGNGSNGSNGSTNGSLNGAGGA